MLERRIGAIEARQRWNRQHFRPETPDEEWRRLSDGPVGAHDTEAPPVAGGSGFLILARLRPQPGPF